jgi:hypothetical protein
MKFLDENIPVGTKWEAAKYLRTRNGVADTVTIEAIIHSRRTSELTGSITFFDVINVGYFYYSRGANDALPFLFAREEKRFARKVGMIRFGTELEFNLQRVRVE